jgi:hypothetical protein
VLRSTNQIRGRSWPNVISNQKYKAEQNCEEGTQLTRAKARKVAKTPQAKTVAKAKPKRATVKKAARKVKQPAAPVAETVVVDLIEQPAPGVITVTEVEETFK